MKNRFILAVGIVCLASAACAQQGPPPVRRSEGREAGAAVGLAISRKLFPRSKRLDSRQIFDGKSMDGWDCDPDFWKVENGEIIGETHAGSSTTAEHLLYLERRRSPPTSNCDCNTK